MDIISRVVLGATFFALVWVAILEVLSRAGGWKRVARRYPATAVPEGRKFSMQHCAFGWVDYNGCLTIVVSSDGVYLCLWPLFRLSHPALLIPWSALHVLKVKPVGWFKVVKLAIDEPPLATLTLPYKVVEAAQGLARAWDPALAAEPGPEREE